MRVLITGASGLLGRYLLMTAPEDWSVTPTHYSRDVFNGNAYRLDITDRNTVMYVMERVKPDIVIHCAAIGSVDYCEKNREHARQVNAHGTMNVLAAAKEYCVTVVHISSNAVFDGENPPYSENDPRNPVNFYGMLKRDAEDYVMNYESDWVIVRPIMLYGWPYPGGRGNWATRFDEFLSAGLPMKMVHDTVTQPTYAADCAKAIWKLLENSGPEYSIYHIGGADRLSLYEYARVFASLVPVDFSFVEPVDSETFPTLAKRPVDTTYDLSRMISAGMQPVRLYDGLKRMRDEVR